MAKFVYINQKDTCPKLSKYPNKQHISVTVVIAVTLVTFFKLVNFYKWNNLYEHFCQVLISLFQFSHRCEKSETFPSHLPTVLNIYQ